MHTWYSSAFEANWVAGCLKALLSGPPGPLCSPGFPRARSALCPLSPPSLPRPLGALSPPCEPASSGSACAVGKPGNPASLLSR
jgi:hypothetical protein